MRKEADFNLVDRIKIHYQTEPKLKEAILLNLDYLKNETLALEVTEGVVHAGITKDLNINGMKTKISLQRVTPA
jgi:isoleucyl-tRNA synthetase